MMKITNRIIRKIRHLKYQLYLAKNRPLLDEKLMNLKIESGNIVDGKTDVEWIVFSKDRAMQLHAFILSYFDLVVNPAPITILYTTSNKEHEHSYSELKNLSKNYPVTFIRETNFKPQLITILKKIIASKIIFFCDDGVVTESFDMNDFSKFNPYISVPSLLRGLDFTYCFAFQKSQDLPVFLDGIIPDPDKKVWIWKDCPGSPDWSYPLSVGGHLFSRKEMLLLLEFIDFKGPNSLEGNLQYFINIFNQRYGICYTKTQLGSTPANIVNSEVITNATSKDLSVDELLKKWNQGQRIQYENFKGKTANEIYKMKFEFTARNSVEKS